MATATVAQAENRAEQRLSCAGNGWTLAVILFLLTAGSAPAQSTSSPLEILKQAPKVRIEDDPPVTPVPQREAPMPRSAPPYAPSQSEAPYIEPVYPALTPYAGNSTRPAPGYGAPNAYRPAPTPTPRPVLGPEDVDRDKPKKKGLVRGLINSIPFVGGSDDKKTARQSPTPSGSFRDPSAQTRSGLDYEGMQTPEPLRSDEPLLLPPQRSTLPSDPEPSSPPGFAPPRDVEPSAPPILTPEPRVPVPADDNVDLDQAPTTVRPTEETNRGSSLLTIRREDSPSTPTAPADSDSGAGTAGSIAPEEPKQPSRAESTIEPTPRPLEKATTGVLVQESRPRAAVDDDDTNLGPQPDASAKTIRAFDPTETTSAADEADAGESPDAVNDEVTSLTIKQPDLGMPNPAYEQNTAILAEFQAAVRLAREADYAAAAKAFREYALHHPSSGLAPRAAFLAVIFEKSRSQVRKDFEALESNFPKSRYVGEAKSRRSDVFEAASSPAATVPSGASADASVVEIPGETPQQQIYRLEQALTEAVGDPAKEPEIRLRLGNLYLQQENFGKAYEILRPAADMAEGQPLNGEVLLALARTMTARGETVQAIGLFQAVEEKHPGLIESKAETAWSVGLAFEGVGNYTRARALYNTLRQNFPASREAAWATERLNDLAALRR